MGINQILRFNNKQQPIFKNKPTKTKETISDLTHDIASFFKTNLSETNQERKTAIISSTLNSCCSPVVIFFNVSFPSFISFSPTKTT